MLCLASFSAHDDGVKFSFPDGRLEAVVNVARLFPAERASDGAMGLLCLITQGYYALHTVDLPSVSNEGASVSADGSDANHGMAMEDAEDDPESQEARAAVVGGLLAGLGAATVALAHLQTGLSPAPAGAGEARHFSHGAIARFVSWICKAAPEVFLDLQERGLLELLVDLLRSDMEDERPDLGIAVAALALHLDAARIPLRALQATMFLTEKLKVRPGLFTHAITVTGSESSM
jgi:hypothetical protein